MTNGNGNGNAPLQHGTKPNAEELRARARQAGRPTMNDPKVIEALNSAAAIEKDRDEMFDLCRRQEVDIEVRDQRIGYLEREWERTKREASKFESAFLMLQAAFTMMGLGANTYYNSCMSAIDAAKDELRKAGIDPDRTMSAATGDAALKSLGESLGANMRDRDADRNEDKELRAER